MIIRYILNTFDISNNKETTKNEEKIKKIKLIYFLEKFVCVYNSS